MTARSCDPVRKLNGSDAVESFDCSQPALNQFLQRFALVNQKSNSAQTYVSCCEGAVVGFYSLAVGSVQPAAAAPRVIKGQPQHPVPVMILARLAVDVQHQGKGLGKALLKDALLRTAQAADIAGIRALLVHALDLRDELGAQPVRFRERRGVRFHLHLHHAAVERTAGDAVLQVGPEQFGKQRDDVEAHVAPPGSVVQAPIDGDALPGQVHVVDVGGHEWDQPLGGLG